MHEDALVPSPKGFREESELLSAAASELDERDRILERGDHLRSEAGEKPALGARDAVPRQPADGLEERGAQSVVEVLRLDLPRGQREIAPDIASEILNSLQRRRLGAFGDQEAVSTVRNLA